MRRLGISRHFTEPWILTDAFCLVDLLHPSRVRVQWWKLFAYCCVISLPPQGKLHVRMSVPFLTISAIAFQAHEESNMHHSGNWWFRNTTSSVLGFISHALLEGTNLMLYINIGVLVNS